MSEPFLGQIIMFGGSFAPRGWAFCDGQLLAIPSYTALFSILNTTYGGDGRTTFGLPDLRGRVPMHAGNGPGLTLRTLGLKTGTETHTLVQAQTPLPNHSHSLTDQTANVVIGARTEAPNTSSPGGAFLGDSNIYVNGQGSPNIGMKNDAAFITGNTDNTGSTSAQAHNNIQPVQVVNFIIALTGVYPSRS